MYDIELKNQTGESVIYTEIGEISIPLSGKKEEGIFSARHNVDFSVSDGIDKECGETCAFGVDYIAMFTSKNENIASATPIVFINGHQIDVFDDSTTWNGAVLKRISNCLLLKIPGTIITGDISIEVEL